MSSSLVSILIVLFLPWQVHASIGQEGDPSTCPLLTPSLSIMQATSHSSRQSLNFTSGVPLRLTGIVGLTQSQQRTVDISGIFNPASWQRDGRPGYERNTSVEELQIFRRDLHCSTVYLSFNERRGWWMLHPTFDLGSDGTSGWAIVEAPKANFAHQIAADVHWKVITEKGVEERFVSASAEPTLDFFLALSAIIDNNGDEVLEATEVSSFSFGHARAVSLELGRDWVAQADQDDDGILTMREVALGYKQLTQHKLAKRWLEDTALVEAALGLLQREIARERDSLPADVQALQKTPPEERNAEEPKQMVAKSVPAELQEGADDARNCSAVDDNVHFCTKGYSGWLPFRLDSKCPLASSGNKAFAWSRGILLKYAPTRMLTR